VTPALGCVVAGFDLETGVRVIALRISGLANSTQSGWPRWISRQQDLNPRNYRVNSTGFMRLSPQRYPVVLSARFGVADWHRTGTAICVMGIGRQRNACMSWRAAECGRDTTHVVLGSLLGQVHSDQNLEDRALVPDYSHGSRRTGT